MPTRAEILDTLAASQTQVIAFFQGLSPEDLARPATAWEHVRGGNAAWPKEQDWRSFLLCQTVECLVSNETAEDLCAPD